MRLGAHGQTLRWRPSEIIIFLETAIEVGLVKPKAEEPSPEGEEGTEEPD